MPKVTVPNPSWWMGWHSSALSSWQCAYAENVHIRNPEYVTLWQRSENVCSTGTSLMLCSVMIGSTLFFWWEDGNVYNEWEQNPITITWFSIYNMVVVGNYLYLASIKPTAASSSEYKISRISVGDVYTYADWSVAPSRTDIHTGVAGKKMAKYLFKWDDLIYADDANLRLLENDASWTITYKQRVGTRVCWLWVYGQDNKAITWNGEVAYLTPWLDNINFSTYMSNSAMCGFVSEGMEYYVLWWDNGSSMLYAPNGYGKQLIAKSVVDESIESQEKFHFGRASEIYSPWSHSTKLLWNDVQCSSGGITYIISKWKLLSRWNHYRGLPISWDYATVTNSDWDSLQDIWMTVAEKDGTSSFIYYSWKNDSGDCWVDRIDVSSHEPDLFHDSWVWYTQKFIFWDVRAKIHGFRVRAYTTPGQKFDVYISLDGWSYELLQTFDNTDPKLYTEIQKHYEAYECQFKIVPSTDDTSLAPKWYWFTFMADGIDG